MIPVFCELSDEEQASLLTVAQSRRLSTGEVLFYEGDLSDRLYLLKTGRCSATFAGASCGDMVPEMLLDPVAALGGLPHTVKITAVENCELLYWPMEFLWQSATFNTAARRYLATQLQKTSTRLTQLTAPIHYASHAADLIPGPFLFEDVTMLFLFCEAAPEPIEKSLPAGLSLLQRPGKKRAPLLLALADFPKAYPQHTPEACFAYTETTYFIPVRHGTTFGFYVPSIYPSTYEPILLGREIYGFPKRLGETTFSANEVSLSVDGQNYLHFEWQGAESETEPRLVRALMDWLGLQGRLASAAFQAGDLLRKASRLPGYRRVNVFNHRRLLAADSTHDQPTYAVSELTQAAFGVLKWYQVNRLNQPELQVTGGILTDVTLREAFRTKLDMRLSTARVVQNYLAQT
ncbi:MAG: acetoacetate decarboxylase family protein [Anaerolineae bacterium]|nr:acetoacetate decarboxylase family protein [Anaerolineae bacterium]